MPDTDKVIKDLTRCQRCECDNCTLEDKSGYPWDCTARENMIDYAIAKLKELEEQIKNRDASLEKAREEIKWLRGMLKELEAVVRCKDCKYCEYPKSEKEWCKKGHLHGKAETWFCADGKRR